MFRTPGPPAVARSRRRAQPNPPPTAHMTKSKLDLKTGWRFAKTESKSKTVLTGLTSGKRYWLRVTANGTAGPGPASDAVTKTAP